MDEEAFLLVIKNDQYEDGFPFEKIEKKIPVYVKPLTVSYKEFYEAMRSGIDAAIVFEIRIEDWEESLHKNGDRNVYAEKIEYDGTVYNVVRHYIKGKAKVQVTCK